MAYPLYMSYWVGMTAGLCGVTSNNLTATGELQSQIIS